MNNDVDEWVCNFIIACMIGMMYVCMMYDVWWKVIDWLDMETDMIIEYDSW